MDTILYLIAVRNHPIHEPPSIHLLEKADNIRLILVDVNITTEHPASEHTYSSSILRKRTHSLKATDTPLASHNSTKNITPSIKTTNTPHISNRKTRSTMTAHLRHYRDISQNRKTKRQLDANLRQQIASILITLAHYLEHTHSCSTIYDTTLQNWLEARGQWNLWQDFWPYYPFTGYRDPAFVNPLLQYAHAPHYLIIGYDPYVTEFITARAKRMKSLRFLLDYGPKGLGDFLDDLYDEYGLPASFTMLPAPVAHNTDWDTNTHPFRQALIECSVPSVIIDYSEEPNLRITHLAPGSLWLDIDGDEEKRRLLETRFPDVTYLSLKKLWRSTSLLH